ncbi:MAG TPA: hypothetical protein VF437_02775 [Verrucomicrobiae bacterium]|jgi:hypothetical protein
MKFPDIPDHPAFIGFRRDELNRETGSAFDFPKSFHGRSGLVSNAEVINHSGEGGTSQQGQKNRDQQEADFSSTPNLVETREKKARNPIHHAADNNEPARRHKPHCGFASVTDCAPAESSDRLFGGQR